MAAGEIRDRDRRDHCRNLESPAKEQKLSFQTAGGWLPDVHNPKPVSTDHRWNLKDKFLPHMPREEYDFLTDQTRDVLTDNVKAIAHAWNKCQQYIYAILQGEKKDFFAAFLPFYTAVCKAGVSTAAWDRELAHVRQRYSKDTADIEPVEAFSAKYEGNNKLFEKYLKAIQDGKLTLEELDDLEPCVDIEIELTKVLKKAIATHRVKLENKGK